MIQLYFHPISNPSLLPLFVASAAGIEFERVMVDLQKQEQQGDDFKRINPFARVPAMRDGDLYLGESGAIARYLARKSGTDLYSEDLAEAALIDQWCDFIAHHIRANVARVQFNRFVAPLLGQEPDQASIDLGLDFLSKNLPHVELALDRDGHLHGDRLTLADIALVAAMEPQHTAKLDMSDYPITAAWLDAQRKSEWYQAVHTHFGAEMGL